MDGTAAKSESVGGGEPRSLIGSDIFIVSVSSVSGALQVASGGGARGKGQGAGAGHCALFCFFSSCWPCWDLCPIGGLLLLLLLQLERPPPCCRNPRAIHVNPSQSCQCLALVLSRSCHFAASSQRVCAALLGGHRVSRHFHFACLLFSSSGCPHRFSICDPQADPRPDPHRISPDPSDRLAWMHSA
jgi:hypothetical protein